MSAEATPRPDDTAKLYYSIREVSELLDVKPHVLRYWESQFRTLRPKKSRAGNRMYRPKDVDQLREIQHLLHVRRYTIAGARQELQRRRRSEPEPEDMFPEEFDTEPEVFHAEESGSAGAISRRDGSGSVREPNASMEGGDELELFPIGATATNDPSPNADSSASSASANVSASAGAEGAGGTEAVANLDARRSAGGSHGVTRWDEQGLPTTGSQGVSTPGVSAADLAPLRDEIRQLKEWLEAGIVGTRNRG